jgi:DNA-binding NtrC family response regulator
MAAPTMQEPASEPETETETPVLFLVVTGPDLTISHRLPAAGTMLIGRAEDAPVRLLDPRASRNHALLRVEPGERVTIEDLRSANGTRVRDALLTAHRPAPLSPGEAVTIGDTVLTLQRRTPPGRVATRAPLNHGAFESQLIEACARAEARRGPLALARLRIEAGPSEEAAATVVGALLRPGDCLGRYAPSDLEVLLPDTAGAAAEALVARLAEALRAAGARLRLGLARYPDDGSSPQALLARAAAAVTTTAAAPGGDGVVVASPRMIEVFRIAERAAGSDLPVLILGETGVGKEVLARFVHERSRRATQPLTSINCAALTDTLLEAELFGHERGAFTGAVQARAGLLESASGGTVFLDEVGEMSLALQAKLLRAIESQEVTRVGATRPRAIDVRFVAATNRDLDEEVQQRTFRKDLLFRLNALTLTVPPLRERLDEIEPLSLRFLAAAASRLGRPAPRLGPGALAWLRGHPWPGNIRELRNVLERAVVLCEGDTITTTDLPVQRLGAAPAPPTPAAGGDGSWRKRAETTERQAIVEALERCAGNQTRAAEWLGMPRRTFCAKLAEYDIPRPRRRGAGESA